MQVAQTNYVGKIGFIVLTDGVKLYLHFVFSQKAASVVFHENGIPFESPHAEDASSLPETSPVETVKLETDTDAFPLQIRMAAEIVHSRANKSLMITCQPNTFIGVNVSPYSGHTDGFAAYADHAGLLHVDVFYSKTQGRKLIKARPLTALLQRTWLHVLEDSALPVTSAREVVELPSLVATFVAMSLLVVATEQKRKHESN